MIDSTERLLAYRDRDFEYDLNGRLRAESYITPGSDNRIRCYTYDVLGALHRWEDRAGPAASGVTLTSVCASPFSTITDHAWVEYDLDATGRRIGRRAWTDTGGLDEERYWVYLDALNPIAQFDAEGRVTQLYVYGTHEHSPDAMITWDYGTCTGPSCTPTEAHHRILHDIRGSVRMVYNTTTGAITQQLDYDEFGVVTTNTAPFAQPFGYAGGEYDHLTGLTRFGARDYDPTLGRWTAPDPIGFAGGDSNLYSYVGGRVVALVDVTGEQAQIAIPVVAGGVVWFLNACARNPRCVAAFVTAAAALTSEVIDFFLDDTSGYVSDLPTQAPAASADADTPADAAGGICEGELSRDCCMPGYLRCDAQTPAHLNYPKGNNYSNSLCQTCFDRCINAGGNWPAEVQFLTGPRGRLQWRSCANGTPR